MWCLKLLIFSVVTVLTCATPKRLLIDQLRWDFLELENSLWNFSQNDLLNKELSEAEIYLVEEFYGFDQQLKKMPSDLLFGVDPLRTLPDFLFLYTNLNLIDVKYTKFRDYLNQISTEGKISKISTEDVIYDVLNNQTGVEKVVHEIYKIAYDQADSMKQELHRMIQKNFWCKDLSQSPQQLFYNLYNLIALSTLKAYAMQQFAYLGSVIWAKEQNDRLSENARKRFEQRSTMIIRGMLMAMKQSNQLWRCDPETFIKGVNYDEFTRLLQGHIQNEVDMSSSRTCRQTCNDYLFTKSYGCYDYESDVCRRTERCGGNIIGCFFVESHASICVSPFPNRRYDFIRYNSGKTLGQARGLSASCPNSRTVNSWTRWFVRCHYCMCLCDEQGPKSDRYINLRPVKSDVEHNMVVTGIRLVKHNRILHVQIQEGKLLPYGRIDQESVRWKKVDDYKITDHGVKNKVDMFTMTYDERSMSLNDIEVIQDFHVLTGVSFKYLSNKIYLQIHVSPFDWHNGTVYGSEGFDIYETSKQTSQYSIVKPDVPTRTPTPSAAHHEDSFKYITFTHTDFDKDAAQTTIPFIDTQEVVSKPAVPLKGAGIFYKGNQGYGGFIAPTIKTYDFLKHLSTAMPPIQDRIQPYLEDMVEIN